MKPVIDWMEKGLLPDGLIRAGIRKLNRERLRRERHGPPSARLEYKMKFVNKLRQSPVAVKTDKANEQHYEVPTSFFQKVLGPHMKYSGCFWNEAARNLEDAERASLEQVCRRAELKDGRRIILSCGGGMPPGVPTENIEAFLAAARNT